MLKSHFFVVLSINILIIVSRTSANIECKNDTKTNNTKCRDNELYDGCVNGGCFGPRNCSQIGKPFICIDLIEGACKEGCICKDNYLRNNDGLCIPQEQCPNTTCRANETYVKCPNFTCAPQTCDEIGFPKPCPQQSPNATCPGNPGCICINGYVRDKRGVCVPKKECPSCGGDPNAQSGCGINCGRLCSNYNTTFNPDYCPKICKANGCDCKCSYVLDTNTGKCVRPENCTPVCKENERYSNCTNGGCYGARTCSEKGRPIICVRIDPENCKKGCLCADGYLRNDNGTCVPEKECPVCKVNETYVQCPNNSCKPLTCDEVGYNKNCTTNSTAPCTGEPGCICSNNYVRDENGTCIPRNQCPSCGGDPNAQAGCGINCGRLCSNYNDTDVVCIEECNLNGCDCKCDYVYDTNTGKCVYPEDCTPVCKENEEYSNCTNGGCYGPRKCSEIGQSVRCVNTDPKNCTKGCVCISGYLRSGNGTCIPKEKCPTKCPKPNQVYTTCVVTCPPQTCTSIGKIYECPLQNATNNSCIAACVCKPGYYRNSIGECISKENCLKCNGTNEYFSCGGACDNVCSTLSQQNQTNCPIINIKCNEMCYCNKGYARDANNTCIPINKCPRCNANEIYVDCPDNSSDPLTCNEVGYPKQCTLNSSTPCPGKPGCICSKNYVRDENGTCIPKGQCPSCGGDPNAQAGCGINCGRLCSNYNDTDVVCLEECDLNGCDCKPDYVYDTNTGKCVYPEDCTPVCKENEEYSNCTNGGCYGPRKCSEIGQSVRCVNTDPKNCTKGCVCISGYLRSGNGTCIPKEKCPMKCSKPNQVYTSCAVTCPPQTCTSIGKLYECPLQNATNNSCIAACVCITGYYRNSIGECISKENCLKCNGSNEYYSCGGACDNVCATLSQQNQTNCPTVNIKCNEMCYCNKGYARDAYNNCIPIDKCPIICGANEEPSNCTQAINRNQYCNETGTRQNNSKTFTKCECSRGCVCMKGYLRSNNGTCIPEDQCSCVNKICSKENEICEPCPAKCPARTCGVDDRTALCPKPLEVGDPKCPQPTCKCQNGFYRNSKGNCVTWEECGNDTKCSKPNEEYDPCPAKCPLRTCGIDDRTIICTPSPYIGDPDCALPKCRCQDGYYKDDCGDCVTWEQCPTCGINEEYSCCVQAVCRNQNCTQKGQAVVTCTAVAEGSCMKGCVCKDKYLRSSNGTCVLEDQCDTCPEGEIYNTCPPQKCDAEYCATSRYSPTSCNSTKNCGPPRCTCGFNAKRCRKSGKCIATVNCPPFPCDGANEEYQSCPPVCPGQKCSDYINNSTCPKYRIGIVVPCTPQCRCKDKFYRNSTNVCVTGSQCKAEYNSTTTTVAPDNTSCTGM